MELKVRHSLMSFILHALLMNNNLAEAGTTYTRWGRTTCNGGAEVVYKGYMASSHHNYPGGGANFLCLHESPQWGNVISGRQWASAFLYGVEFELHSGYSNNQPLSYENVGGQNLHDQDAVCVVCYQPERSTSVMIPGRLDCEPNNKWQVEYSGYLMAQFEDPKYLRHRSEFICMDQAPESRPGGEQNANQGVLYPVQAVCGSLPCPGYVENSEITCVVCSR